MGRFFLKLVDKKENVKKVRNYRFRTVSLLFIKCSTWLWKGTPANISLVVGASIVSLLMAIPIFYVVWRSLFAGSDRWMNILDSRIPSLLWNTLSLTGTVTFFAVIIGVSCAWFVTRMDVSGYRYWSWLLALPLIIPPYVGAMTYIIIIGPRGWLQDIWNSLSWVNIFGEYPFDLYSFCGLAFILTMFTYPYVFLVASATLRKINRSYEDVARSHGYGTFKIFWTIQLPFLRKAIGGGAILVSLYVLSDFGAVAMLRYTTFTSAIYYQMGSYDNLTASVLSLVLIILTMLVLWLESSSRKKHLLIQTSNSFIPVERLKLRKWKPFVFVYLCSMFVVSFVIPVVVLFYWSFYGVVQGAIETKFWIYAWNSLLVSGSAALCAVIFSLPIIYLKIRYPSRYIFVLEKLAYSGYALPGVIVALGVIFIFNQYIPWLYQTAALLSIVYIIRFLPQAMQAGESTLSMISPRIDESARSLGYSPRKVLSHLIIPLMLPGLLAGAALVFVSSIKELPATLLLRPPGFDTLSVRIWIEASEANYVFAAPSALLIILISILPLRYLLNQKS